MQEQEFESVLKIHCCRFERGISPWRQQRLLTPYWRFYWNPVRGGFLRFGDEIVALEPELFYVIPGYLEFSTFAEQPFEQFYIHFNLSDRQPLRRELYRLPADPPTLARIRAFIDWENDKEYMQLRQLAAISILSASLLRLPPELFRVPARFDPRIAGLCDWIRHHPSEHVSNDEFAARLRNLADGLRGQHRSGSDQQFVGHMIFLRREPDAGQRIRGIERYFQKANALLTQDFTDLQHFIRADSTQDRDRG